VRSITVLFSLRSLFTAQLSSQLMQTEILRPRIGPVELLNNPFGAFALGGGPVRKVTTTNVVKVCISRWKSYFLLKFEFLVFFYKPWCCIPQVSTTKDDIASLERLLTQT
jgi:hypothetical protein